MINISEGISASIKRHIWGYPNNEAPDALWSTIAMHTTLKAWDKIWYGIKIVDVNFRISIKRSISNNIKTNIATNGKH